MAEHHHNRFFFAFDFAAFGFPWWYPDYYYGYPYYCPYYGYEPYYGYGAAYDPQYWSDLAVSVQSGLAQRGYYHGVIDGENWLRQPSSDSSVPGGARIACHRND
jgi:hypothetical protein